MRGLSGKVAIVTGAASPIGMGFATAKRLAEEGTRVVMTDIDHAEVAARAAELRSEGHQAIACAHDATDEAAWEEVLRATKAEFGVLDVNSTMAFLGCRMAAREMQATGRGGAIVNVVSIASIVAGEYGGAYCASKGAVQMLTKVLAIETAKQGIRVNSVHPGYTATATLGDANDEGAFAQTIANIPAGRLGQAAEMASAIAFLASDDAAYCNGSMLVVDGGLTAQ